MTSLLVSKVVKHHHNNNLNSIVLPRRLCLGEKRPALVPRRYTTNDRENRNLKTKKKMATRQTSRVRSIRPFRHTILSIVWFTVIESCLMIFCAKRERSTVVRWNCNSSDDKSWRFYVVLTIRNDSKKRSRECSIVSDYWGTERWYYGFYNPNSSLYMIGFNLIRNQIQPFSN